MRELLSRRFWAAVGAVIVLSLVVVLVGSTTAPTASLTQGSQATRRVDIGGIVMEAELEEDWGLLRDRTVGVARLVLADGRQYFIGDDTPGVRTCARVDRPGACALLADVLGDAVIWFALAPVEPGGVVTLPGIVEVLDAGREGGLSNGWVVALVDVVTRVCSRVETSSFRDFVARIGARSTSTYDLAVQEISTITCLDD
jgi:hypothetical protein